MVIGEKMGKVAQRFLVFFKPVGGDRKADLMVSLSLLIASLLFFWDLFEERYLLTERDLALYFIPPRFFWVESLKQLNFPFWNPYSFSGSPFFANPQNAALYPLNGLFFLLPFDIAFNTIIILHFFLAGLFTYLLMREMKVGCAGSLIAGHIWMLGGYLLSVHSLLTILLSVVWTPLVMLFFRRAMLHPGIKNEIVTAILMVLSFLGGGIEVVYGNFFVLILMVLFTSAPLPLSNGVRGIGFIPLCIIRLKTIFIISTLFILLSAVQFIPFLELWMHSIRGQGITYQEATIWSFAPKDLLLFFLPDAYGYFLDMKKYWVTQCWLKTMYTGGFPFILSFCFFRFGTNRKLFLSLMLFSLFLALGQHNPLYLFVYKYVPFFNGIRYPVKFLYIFILCLAITAGLGFEKIQQYSKQRDGGTFKHLLMAFSLLSGLGLLFLVAGHGQVEPFLKAKGFDFPEFNHLSTNLYHAKRFFFYLTLFFLFLRVGYEVGWKGWVKVALIFFLTVDLFGNMGFYGKEKAEDYFKKTRIIEMATMDQGAFRVFSTAKTISLDTPILIGDFVPFDLIKEKHIPSLNMIFRIHDIWGIDVVRLKRTDDLYKRFTNLPSISSSNFVDLYGIKYVISVTPLDEDPRFELVYARLEGLVGKREDLLKENTIKLYENKKPLKRVWLVKDYRVMDQEAILETIASKEFSPGEEALLEEEIPHPAPLPMGKREKGRGNKAVEFISETNNRLTLSVDADTESILVLSDTYYPGWKAFVNGREEKILRANYNFRAVLVPKGKSRVEFVYRPVSFKLGMMMTLMGILICGALWRMDRKRDGRR